VVYRVEKDRRPTKPSHPETINATISGSKKVGKCRGAARSLRNREYCRVPEEGGRDVNHLIHQFLIVIQKHSIENISRTEGVLVGRNEQVVEENGLTKTIMIKWR
jgi:hypothetical protein